MDKKPSFVWAFAVGLMFVVLQLIISLLGFSSLNPNVNVTDYLFFFIGGTIIGLGLIYLLRRSQNKGTSRGTIIGFVIGIPFALFGMLLGGVTGPLGSVLFSMSPGIFITAVGYFLGRTFSKKAE